LESGNQDIVTFEKHRKGIGMKILSNFGYMKGKGLGNHGRGRAKSIKVRERPLHEGLGYAKESIDDNNPVVCCTHCQKFRHDVDHCWDRHPELKPA